MADKDWYDICVFYHKSLYIRSNPAISNTEYNESPLCRTVFNFPLLWSALMNVWILRTLAISKQFLFPLSVQNRRVRLYVWIITNVNNYIARNHVTLSHLKLVCDYELHIMKAKRQRYKGSWLKLYYRLISFPWCSSTSKINLHS